MKSSRWFLLLSPLILLVCLELFLIWPKLLFVFEAIAVIWLIFVIRYFALRSSLGKKWIIHALLPLLLFTSLSFSATILVNRWLIQVIFVFLILFLSRYLKLLYNFWVKNDLKQIDRLPNFSLSAGLIIIFSAIFNIYSLQVFVSWSTWSLFFLSCLAVILVTYHNWQICQMNIKENLNLFVIINLLLVETIAVLFFWPFAYQLLALVVVLIYYVLINCARLYLSANLDKAKIKFYLIFSALVFLVLILSARWF